MMKRSLRRTAVLGATVVAVAVAGFVSGAAAQDDELRVKYEKKLEKEFVKKVAWKRELDEAMKEAKAQNRLILGYFTRSYSP